MGKFVADPETLIEKGGEMNNTSQSFEDDIKKVYNTLDEMISKDYLSPEALVIARKIESQRKDLEEMAKVIAQYGKLSTLAGNKVYENQDNISSEVQ